MSELVFRRFTPVDLDEVMRLNAEALRAVDAYIEVAGYYADLADIPGQYLAPGDEFLVVVAGSELVAMGGVQLHAEVAELRRLRVRPASQGRGIGKELMRRREQFARDHGCTRVRVDTTLNQPAAQAMFLASGYRELRRGSKGGPLPTIFYEKTL